MSQEWRNIKINSCCGKMFFCLRGLNWLLFKITFSVKSLWAYEKKSHCIMQRPNDDTNAILSYIFVSHCKSIPLSLSLFFPSLSQKLFTESFSGQLLLLFVWIWHSKANLHVIINVVFMSVTIKSFLNHLWSMGIMHPDSLQSVSRPPRPGPRWAPWELLEGTGCGWEA